MYNASKSGMTKVMQFAVDVDGAYEIAVIGYECYQKYLKDLSGLGAK